MSPALLRAQPVYEVTGLEGTAKIQHAQKQKWDKLSVGDKVNDNDIVETFFQTKLVLKFGESNCAVFGSNTKVLLTLAGKEAAEGTINEANFSVFNGGIFVKAVAKTHLSAFSTNAVAEMDSGAMAVIVDARTGETGVLVLGGKAVARNIAQQKGKELTVGLTTIVVPGREPTPPLYLSFRHVAVLKHFFGDKYISDELQASAITPSDDRSSVSRIALSQGFTPKREKSEVLFYKRIFNVNKIYGSIITHREMYEAPYAPLTRPAAVSAHGASIAASAGIGSAGETHIPRYSLSPCFTNSYCMAALRFPVYDNYYSRYIYGYKSMRGVLDKFEQVAANTIDGSLSITAGAISGVTLGNGLIVNGFRNTDNNRLFHPLGLTGKAALSNNEFTAGVFLADLTDPTFGGVHVALEPSAYYLGAGYYFDLDPYRHPLDSEDYGYTGNVQHGTLFKPTSTASGVGIFEFDFGVTVARSYDFSSRVFFEVAQKRLNGAQDGYLMKVPSLLFGWPKFRLGGGFLLEKGRIISQQFDGFYYSRRSYLKCGRTGQGSVDTMLTINTALWKRRLSNAVFVSLGSNPVRGSDISMELRQDFRARNVFAVWTANPANDSMQISSPLDYSIDCRLAVDKRCVPFLRYGSLYYRQIHGALFPRASPLFVSWNTEAGIECITEPIYFNISLELGGRMFFIDKGPRPNDVINSGELVKEGFIGIRWGFR